MSKRILRVATSTLKPGEVLAQDIIEHNKIMVKGAMHLRPEDIAKLKAGNIMAVSIFSNPERELAELKYEEVLEHGLQYAVSNRLDAAEMYFGYAIRKDKGNINANLYRGVALFLHENYDEARQRFRNTLDLVLLAEHQPDKSPGQDIQNLKKRLYSYIEFCGLRMGTAGLITRLLYRFNLIKFEPIRFTDYDAMIPRVEETFGESDLLTPEVVGEDKPATSAAADLAPKLPPKEPEGYDEFKAVLNSKTASRIEKEIQEASERSDIELYFFYGCDVAEKEKEIGVLSWLCQYHKLNDDQKRTAHRFIDKIKHEQASAG